MELNLEDPGERSTSPSLGECEVTCSPLCERVEYDRVILDIEYSLPPVPWRAYL
jgi:hypothetical protein